MFAAPLYLPWALEGLLLRTARDLGLPNPHLTIRHLGITRMDIGPCDLGKGLHVDALHADYSLAGLLKGQVNALHILGLRITVDTRSGKMVIPGFLSRPTASNATLRFPRLPDIEDLRIDGMAVFKRQTHLQTVPFALDGQLRHPDIFALTVSLPAGQTPTIHLQGSIHDDDVRVAASTSALALNHVAILTSGLAFPAIDGALDANASLRIRPEHTATQASVTLRDVSVPSLDLAQADALSANFSDSGLVLSPLRLSRPWPLELLLSDIRLDTTAQSVSAAWELTTILPGGQNRVRLAGALEYNAGEKSEDTAALRLTARPATIRHADTILRLEALTFTARHIEDSFHGRLSCRGSATLPDFSVNNIALDLPLAWPPAQRAEQGRLGMDLRKGKTTLGRLDLTLEQRKTALNVRGTLTGSVLALKAGVTGALDMGDLDASTLGIELDDQLLRLPGNLRMLLPALGALSGSARVSGQAKLDLSSGTPRLPIKLKLRQAELNHHSAKLRLTGGRLECAFPDLLTLRSEPAQHLRFADIRLGNVLFTKGDVVFQIEHARNILVEECSFSWAGGRVGTQAFRIDPEITDYTVVLYCDRVLLAQALEQLGFTQAQGGGSANGRIPLRYAHGSLTFDQGFLYSTPGEKGVLRLRGTEILTAGVSPDSPQYAQLDLAAEALKDYAYDWAKISMNTQGKELVISLELDGKPARPLPFVFDREVGGFARVSGGSPGSVFQGVRLNVNFRLPLDQLLQYRQLLQLLTNGG